MYKRRSLPASSASNTRSVSHGSLAEFRAPASTPASRKPETWSRISAISGEMTTVSPLWRSAGSWKQSDLPPPVGMMASTSRPARMAATISSCPGRKASKPKTDFRSSLVSRISSPGNRSGETRALSGRMESGLTLYFAYTQFPSHRTKPFGSNLLQVVYS